MKYISKQHHITYEDCVFQINHKNESYIRVQNITVLELNALYFQSFDQNLVNTAASIKGHLPVDKVSFYAIA